jgi:hypothetical protein
MCAQVLGCTIKPNVEWLKVAFLDILILISREYRDASTKKPVEYCGEKIE